MIDWLNDPSLKNMDPVKKELFQHAANQVEGKHGNSMASTLMNLILSANKKGVRFSQEEITLILNIMKRDKSPQEKAQIDHMVHTVTNMTHKYKR